jgi:hypothetical protein
MVVALSLALLVWLYARSRDQEVLDNVPIPVQIALPPGQSEHYSLEVTGPSQITLSFSGPPSRIRDLRGMLQRGELEVHVTVPVPDDAMEEGRYLDRYLDTVRIDTADIQTPPGVTPIIVEGRNRIPVTLFRLIEKRLAVRADTVLDERGGELILEPPTVLVRGPQEVLERVRSIATQPFALPARAEPGRPLMPVAVGPVPLVSQIEGRLVHTTPSAVMVRLTPRRRLYEVKVPIQFLCPANFPLRSKFIGDGRAGEVILRLQGPELSEEPKVVAYVDLTHGSFMAGLNHEAVRLQLPDDFHLAQDPPRAVAFELMTAEPGPKGPGHSP